MQVILTLPPIKIIPHRLLVLEYRADWLSYQEKLRINAAPPGLRLHADARIISPRRRRRFLIATSARRAACCPHWTQRRGEPGPGAAPSFASRPGPMLDGVSPRLSRQAGSRPTSRRARGGAPRDRARLRVPVIAPDTESRGSPRAIGRRQAPSPARAVAVEAGVSPASRPLCRQWPGPI